MTRRTDRWVAIGTKVAAGTALAVGAGAAGYAGLVTGSVPLDVGVGRRVRPLGPQSIEVTATGAVVFDVLAEPYLGRATRALEKKIKVLEHGSDMVLAAHYTPVTNRVTACTVETVRFTRPDRVDFRLVRGPVPHVVETFTLTRHDGGTRLEYNGELGTDLWAAGQWWGARVADRWERAVAETFAAVKAEAEHRDRHR